MTFEEFHYTRIRSSLIDEIENLETYKTVNDFLKNNDWLFISPFFFHGFELENILNLSKKSGNQKPEVTKIIFRKFFKLDWSASFIEGYCKRCNHIEPFLLSIEHSLVLTFQRDYEGAIKTLIPIIEGILRKYLVSEKGKSMEGIKFKDLKNSFLNLKDDLILNYSEGLVSYADENNKQIQFSQTQVNDLITLQSAYLEIWFSFIDEFINNSFYLNTHGLPITNEINRHAILHEYGQTITYNLENYIKIYFVIHFLTWVFLQKEKKSILNQIDGSRYFEKVMAYKNIIEISDKLAYEKHIIYKNYPQYDSNIFLEEFEFKPTRLLTSKSLLKYKMLRNFERYIWKRKLK